MPYAAKGETPRSLALLEILAQSIVTVFLAWLSKSLNRAYPLQNTVLVLVVMLGGRAGEFFLANFNHAYHF